MRTISGIIATGLMLIIFAGTTTWAPAQTRTARSSTSSGAYGREMGDAIVEYDPETGSLIIITDEETDQDIARVIQMLDRPTPQVLIKVLFLEITYNKSYDFGTDLNRIGYLAENDAKYRSEFGLPVQIMSQTGMDGAFVRILKDEIDATLHALKMDGELEILSRPSILARNNEEATISIGQRVPFLTNTRFTDGGDEIQTFEYQDIGIILTVLPRITANRDMIELDVYQEISTLAGQTSQRMDIFAQRIAETSVIVPNGKTIVIGGLMEDQDKKTVRKVPVLGDIPYLGTLFSYTSSEKVKTELLIFLTPTLAETQSDLESMTDREANKSKIARESVSRREMERLIDAPIFTPSDDPRATVVRESKERSRFIQFR